MQEWEGIAGTVRAFAVLTQREIGAYFSWFTGYVLLALVTFLFGLSLTSLVHALNHEYIHLPLTDLFYQTYFYWLILLVTAPVLTMRTFAGEKSTGTYETLMTSPISDLQVVLAKFTGSMAVYTILWMPLPLCMMVLRHYTENSNPIDPGPMLTTFLGILLLGGLFISMGCFASSLTRNQIVAPILALAMDTGLFCLGFASRAIPVELHWIDRLLASVSIIDHMEDFTRGILDTRYLVFYISLTVFFIFLTLKSVERRRWT